jgi:peptidoglycan/xylan/chitin deacetylase (PgdA/CDA1 family)
MKRFFKSMAVRSGLDAFFTKRTDAGVILGFHQVGDVDGSMLSQRIVRIPPKNLEDVILYLQSSGYSFVPLDEIANGSERSRKAAITFDDGFRSVYLGAFPILKKYRVPFTVFLTTATLGAPRLLWLHRIYASVDRLTMEAVIRVLESNSIKLPSDIPLSKAFGDLVRRENPDRLLWIAEALAAEAHLTRMEEAHLAENLYLEPAEILEMLQGGMTIGAHGHQHWCMETLEQSQTAAEIVQCKDQISSLFGIQAEHYALAFGGTNPYVIPLLKQFGFQSLCTAGQGLVRINTNPYALPRLMDETDTYDLASQITRLHLPRWMPV